MLGICGDRAYATQLGNLLKHTEYSSNDLLQYDRGRAAMALGLVGATEFTSALTALLRESNEYDRTGAAYGLGFLKAKDQAGAIAKLLDDEDENVREAAKESLEMMGAADLIKSKGTKKAP
jgi:HEAT repeat protein